MTTIKEDNIYRWVAPNDATHLIFPFAPLAPFTARAKTIFCTWYPFFIFSARRKNGFGCTGSIKRNKRVARLSSQAEQNVTRDKFFLSLMPPKVCTQPAKKPKECARRHASSEYEIHLVDYAVCVCAPTQKESKFIKPFCRGASKRVIKSDSSCAAGSNCNQHCVWARVFHFFSRRYANYPGQKAAKRLRCLLQMCPGSEFSAAATEQTSRRTNIEFPFLVAIFFTPAVAARSIILTRPPRN